jgi:hypothetical protein
MALLSETNKADRTLHCESVRTYSERNGFREVHEVVGNIALCCPTSIHLARLLHQTDWLYYLGKCVTLHSDSPNADFCWFQDSPNKKSQILASTMDSLRGSRFWLSHICRNNLSLKPCPSPHSVGRRAFCFYPIYFTLLCDRGLHGIPIWQKKRVQTANLLSV